MNDERTITPEALDRLIDRAYDTGWQAALSAIELQLIVVEGQPLLPGERGERRRIMGIIHELRNRGGHDGTEHATPEPEA